MATALTLPGPAEAHLDRPLDRLLTDRVEWISGWVVADDGDFALAARVGDREIAVAPCRHPTAPRRPDVRGFWGVVLAQEVLDRVEEGALAIDLSWRGRPIGALRLRVTPLATALARDYPLDLRVHRLTARPRPPGAIVEFPGLGGVGGASLNGLVRLQMLREGGGVPVYSEADHPELWRRICSGDPPPYRWIDGHACHGAAGLLGRPFARVTLLREPVRRLLSIHDYNALVHPDRHGFASFEDFLDSGRARASSQAASLLRISGREPDPRLSDAELHGAAAEELARSYALVGVTERFEETVFLVAELLGLESVGTWWRVLSAPRSAALEDLPLRVRRKAEAAVAADLRLYDEAVAAFADRARDVASSPALERYRAAARARRELPDPFKAVECLRWRQKLADAELAAHRAAEEPRA